MTQTGHAVRLAAATRPAALAGACRAGRSMSIPPRWRSTTGGSTRAPPIGRSSYWEVAKGKPFGIDIDPDAPLKPREALRHVGTAGEVAPEMEDIVRGRPLVSSTT